MKGYRKKDPFGIYTVTPVKWKKGRRNGSAVERTIGRRQSSVNHVTYLPCTHREERERLVSKQLRQRTLKIATRLLVRSINSYYNLVVDVVLLLVLFLVRALSSLWCTLMSNPIYLHKSWQLSAKTAFEKRAKLFGSSILVVDRLLSFLSWKCL